VQSAPTATRLRRLFGGERQLGMLFVMHVAFTKNSTG